MKKVTFLSLLAFVMLASCSTKKSSTTKNILVTVDTTVRMPEWKMQTAPRYSCNGKKLQYKKLLSFDTSSVLVPIKLTKTITVNCDQHSISNHKVGVFNWLKDLLAWLLGLLLLLALIALILSFFGRGPIAGSFIGIGNRTRGGGFSSNKSESEKVPSKDETNITERKTNDWDKATAFLTQLQKTGGTANYSGLNLNIPSQGGINIINVETKTGNVKIHATNDTITEETTIVSFTNQAQEETKENK